MNAVLDRPLTEEPDMATLRERARALAPQFRQRSAATEAARRVPAENIAAMRDAGLLHLMGPRRLGGMERGFNDLVDIGVEIGRGCGSSAWAFGLISIHHWILATFPPEAQDEILGADRDVVICGSYTPVNKAEEVAGGFRVQGSWSFASNCDNATWSLLGVQFPADPATGQPRGPGFVIVPASDYEIEDNWHTVGLCGTGSKNIVVREPLFVPAHRVLTYAQAASSQPPGAKVNRHTGYRVPFLAAIPSSLVAPAIGMVRGAIDDFLEMAGHRITRGAVAGGGRSMAEFQTVQLRIADASAKVDAARLLIERDLNEVEAIAARGETVSVDTRIRNRRDQAFAVKLCAEAIDTVYAAVGGNGMFLSNDIQRAWRDVSAVAKHVSLNWDAVGTMYGQQVLGLPPQGQF
jgi:alkylation response protein AidB-like acyl-CoA dehydrogenase